MRNPLHLRADRVGAVALAALAIALAGVVLANPRPALGAWLGGLGLGSALLAAAVMLRGVRRAARGLRELLGNVRRLAQGDLREPLPARGSPMQALLAEVGERMFRVAVDVRVGTTAIATTVGFVAGDSKALSQRTES